jgi:hypothetical protein
MRLRERNMDIPRIVLEGATYDVVKFLIGAFLLSSGIPFVTSRIFKAVSGLKDILMFGGIVFASILVAFYVLAPRALEPNFVGGVNSIVAGPINGERDTIAIVTISVINSGATQSIIKRWSVEAVVDGQSYNGSFLIPAPKEFRFDNPKSSTDAPIGIIYKGEDDIIQKAMTPIQQGGMVTGLLFVVFKDVPPAQLRS